MHNTPSTTATTETSYLARIFNDLPVDSFVRDYLDRAFLAIPGPPERFSDLLTWSDLNELLETRWVPPGIIRMMKDGTDLPPQSYLIERTRTPQTYPQTRLLPRNITKAMKDGATLIINAIDTMSVPIRALAEELGAALEARVQVNMYACVTSEKHGFRCHYDDHDVIVLQLAGQKHWQVFGPRPVTPYPHEGFQHDERPPVDVPAWHGNLTQGDALYLPRGWWHFARPVNEPTIHLSVGIVRPTGRDLLEWLMLQTEGSRAYRSSLPLYDTDGASLRFLTALADSLTKDLARPDLIQAFARDQAIAGSRKQKVTFGLPWSASEMVEPPSREATIHVATAGRLTAHEPLDGDGTIKLFVDGRPALSLRPKARALCDYISAHAPITVDTFLRRFEAEFTMATLQTILRELAVNHLIVIKSDAARRSDRSATA